MRCPDCRTLTRVIDSRDRADGRIRRRRVCDGCGLRFSSLESWVDFEHAELDGHRHRLNAPHAELRRLVVPLVEHLVFRDPQLREHLAEGAR